VSGGLRILASAFGATGHVFPALALSQELRDRGHRIWFETLERWRDVVEGEGFGFIAAPQHIAGPRRLPGTPTHPTLAEAAQALVPVLRDIDPHVVVNDYFTQAAPLAAELEGVHRATVVHHTYPVSEPGLPHTFVGLLPPRTRAGALAWRLAYPWFSRHARRERAELNEVRAELGLPPLSRVCGGISDELAMVATFPQLEYPRRWPSHVHVTGPMLFELPGPEVDFPDGTEPLVVIAGSTGQDERLEIVETAMEALAGEPVRILATLSGRAEVWSGPLPSNATVVDWLAYSQVLPRAALLVSNGGHGTVVRALSAGVPQVIRPAGGDMGENGARVTWAGAGLMVPRRLLSVSPMRLAAKRALANPGFAARAREIARWGSEHDGAARGADLVERLATA
jgi:UDP:flavonoid glycosyltransferase YjiC (YdhE family)